MTNQDKVSKIIAMHEKGYSSRQISEILYGRTTAKSSVNDILKRVRQSQHSQGPKILFFDVEVSPSVTLAFSRFKAFASPAHVIKEPYLLMYGYAWGFEEPQIDTVEHDQTGKDNRDQLLVERMWDLLDTCDVLIAHNGSFDSGWANQQFALYDLPPPSHYQVVCTWKSAKKAFSLPSNSLAATTKYFNIQQKLSNEGISLWRRCMEEESEAYEEMSEYCLGDIKSLQALYRKILPYSNHPNFGVYYNDELNRCRFCGSNDLSEMDGYKMTAVSKFKTHRCNDCGGISRERKSESRSVLA